mmetsp:Transcript_30892/g.49566  ORF Transcript_30892/g.49566 Transcript_30892/m.49566 type:complete len:831 (-) Transcript_30892:46-2538(-)|eukprot:CAMPEP_0203764596 /NCGR_PEP_ID=MMETSP0098-20131031/17877_1 /ASSEMBLY_ACC=CAM_ASM_000208 /TAXON_ID=96639 /ORGANISM=" , Strain NY0313808BC1" /LENGTH=830 /DNA_ID=CAMNT_0050660643 /DNA_START=1683 /DNA_END=4175 /DNA_ORIENTATION=+
MGGGASKDSVPASTHVEETKTSTEIAPVEAAPQKVALGLQTPGVRQTEINRFREKKKGFTGFRAELVDENSVQKGFQDMLVGGTEKKKNEEDKEKAKKVLKDFPLFDADCLDSILDGMTEVQGKAGDVIYEKGTVFPYCVYVVSGEVVLGEKVVEYANEQALLSPCEAQETLSFKTDATVWVITRLQHQKVTVTALQERIEKGGSLLQSITEIPGLKELPKETRELIAASLKPVTFVKGEYLMKQGERGDTMFFIDSGEVAIRQNAKQEEGKGEDDGIIAYRKRGEYIGEGALLDDGQGGLRSADAIANTDTVSALVLQREEFQQYMGSLHELFELDNCTRVLKTLDLMKDLDDQQLSMIASTLEECAFEPSEFIVHQGEVGDIFYIVKEGTLECTLQEENEEAPKRVGTLMAGDYFGEGALLTNAPRRCNVVAVGPNRTKLWGLKRSNFENYLSDSVKEKLETTFTHRKTAKERNDSSIEWEELQKIRTLGSGSYGTVDLVRHKVTGETYARKRIRKATVVAKKQQRFVKNERELLMISKSRFIVNLIRTFNMGDSVYMLTEVCLSGELYSLMKETVDQRNQDDDQVVCGCFEIETQCRFYTACIILAIEYLHSQGIIHRDIKPENLLVMENGYLKLADFGFAKMIHSQRTYSLCGTPEYTAPEVYKRSGHSKGVDWWSLGVILYEMASGFSPFHVQSQNSWDCYIEISKYEKFFPNIQFPSIFDDKLCDLLLRLMHPNLAKRYGTRKANASHVKAHPFFGTSKTCAFGLNWDQIEAGTYQIDDKFKPRPPESGLDANNFEDCDDRHEGDENYVDDDMMVFAGSWYEDF